MVGVGGMGRGHLDWFAGQPDVEVVALCDVDANHLTAANESIGGKCFATDDFRKVVTRDDVDAVCVATPDHWHALASIAAANAGKHIYCEKPLTNSIGEGRALADAVNKNRVRLQTGSHERSNPGASIAKPVIEEGRLGKVHTVTIQLPAADAHLQEVANMTDPPADTEPPDGLDYDFWLGPAPERSYNPKRCHFWWRFHRDYGGGEMTDRGCHVIDLAHMILGLDGTGPVTVSARGRRPRNKFFDTFSTFEFEDTYADGLVIKGNNQGPRGAKFEGSEGTLFIKVHGGQLVAEPASILDGIAVTPPQHHAAHRRNFVDAIRHDIPLAAPVEAGHRTATVCHLNSIAMLLGRDLKWDSEQEQTGDADADALLTPTMRSPWRV